MGTVTNTQNIITNFVDTIDINTKYTNKELVTILNKIYSEVYKQKKNTTRVPTKYNLFVKDNMSKLKEANPDLSRQDLMRKIGELWKRNNTSEVAEKNSDNHADNNSNNVETVSKKKK
tara:strand:+ start:724 stop:1077 length:354 start_codon:yes stop_codon:yes gene_type:complete